MKYLARQLMVVAVTSIAFLHPDISSAQKVATGEAAESAIVASVLGKMEYLRGFKDSGFNFAAEVATVENGKVSDQHVLDVKVSDKGYALVEVMSPKNSRGRRTLLRDRDLWLYLPSSSNVIRIAPLQRVFGSASIADVLNISYLHGYAVQTNRKSKSGTQLELSLKSNDVRATYARIDLDYDLVNDKPVESRHYTASGRLLKTIQYKSFSNYDGNPKVEKIVIYDGIRKSIAIWMKMSAYNKANYSDALFTKSALPKL
jgi:outer membrane lipoprotein-sorting protein